MNPKLNWSRNNRYRPYKEWPEDYLAALKEKQRTSLWRFAYHVQPVTGLLNDPNGFSYFNGKWQLFYQAYPMGPVHGLKSWYHLTSDNLIDWQEEGLKLLPDSSYDSHGVYSGSALPVENRLFLAYTGNVRDQDWHRHSFQLGAWMDQSGKITKIEQPLIAAPPHGFTQEIRDPQVFAYGDSYLMVIGAQTLEEKGRILMYQSRDLSDWQCLGTLKFTEDELGFMIECPNLLFVDEKTLLIFCPQGLDKTLHSYDNIYPNTYVIGSRYDDQQNALTSPSSLRNLDEGFDVYATQAFTAPDGRTLAVSWIGLPEISYPTDQEGWAHCLSIVKELSIENNTLYQRPIKEMRQLRNSEKIYFDTSAKPLDPGANQYELNLDFGDSRSGTVQLFADSKQKHGLTLSFDRSHGKMVINRSCAGKAFAEEFGTQREFSISNQPLTLQIFVDHSVVEIFINDGQQTATARVFPAADQTKIVIEADTFEGRLWQLRKMNE